MVIVLSGTKPSSRRGPSQSIHLRVDKIGSNERSDTIDHARRPWRGEGESIHPWVYELEGVKCPSLGT
jgi:hypothetical protein